MSFHVNIEDPKCMAVAEEAIAVGRCIRKGADKEKVAQHDAGVNDVFYGISAEASEADGDGIRFYGDGEYCRAVTAVALDCGNGVEEYKLTADSDGKLVKAGASDEVMAIWCPKPGHATASAGDFINVRVVALKARLADA